MASTTWTATREHLVRELATVRQERDNAHASALAHRSRADRLAAERDDLRRRLIDNETRRVDLETTIAELRDAYERTTAVLTLREAEVTQAVGQLANSLAALRRTPPPIPNPDAARNRKALTEALKEKP